MLNEAQSFAAKLQAADRSWQQEYAGGRLLRSTPWALGFLLLCVVLDLIFQLDAIPRVLLLAGMAFGVIGLAGWFFHRAWLHRSPPERIARHIEERDASLGSKLINLLQLRRQSEDPRLSEMTRKMAAQAVEICAYETRNANFIQLARTGRLRRDWKYAAIFCGCFLLLAALFFPVVPVEFVRFVDPFGDHPPFSFTRLEIAEPAREGVSVVYDKNLVVKVRHTGHQPKELFLTFHPPGKPERAVTVPMFNHGNAGFSQQIDQIHSDLVLVAHTGNRKNFSQQRSVRVILTPKFEQAFVELSPPDYTGLKPVEAVFPFKEVRALEGTRVRFRLQSNRPLREGSAEILKSPTEIIRVPLTRSGTNEVAGVFEARDSGPLRFRLVDADGLPSEERNEGVLAVTKDLAPEIQIVNPNKDAFVSMDFKVDVQIEAGDDYGLKQIRIHRALNKVFSTPKVITYEKLARNAHEMWPLVFQDLGIQAGDTVTFFAEAIDTCPTPNLARSQVVNLTVISVEEYNDFLRENSDIRDIEGKYAELLENFHDLLEQQKKLSADGDALRNELEKSGNKRTPAQEQRFDEMVARQNELNEKLNKLAGQMENFVRKNPVYDVESEFQESLKEQAERIRISTAENDAENKQLATRSTPAGDRRDLPPSLAGEFKQAADDQLRRLGAVEKDAQNQLAQTMEDLGALQDLMKDFNRFEYLHQVQQSLTEQARAFNRPEELGREDQLALKNLAATERQVAEELERLEKQLRQDAEAAKEKFPRAAQSANDMADKMSEARLDQLGRQATSFMLSARGDNSFNTADRLRGEMEKLFSECKSQGDQMSGELDQYLSAKKGMMPGNSFRQMMMSKKFGRARGEGQAGKSGIGAMGEDGMAMPSGPNMDVLGGETFATRAESSKTQAGAPGNGRSDKPGDGPVLNMDKTDAAKNVNALNRQSDAVTAESIIGEYNQFVEKYFKAITK
jgi:hypothetical protein